MNGTALTWLPDVLTDAGLVVIQYEGWATRSRSTGGFAGGRPFAVFWHHTASQATPDNDASYCCYGSPDRPICNLLFPRDGTVWVLAAGATNTNGKGQRLTFSRGTVEKDAANTSVVGCEISNSGIGEPYPQRQIDAMFAASNAINAYLGNQPDDVATHHHYAPDRKIDPATGAAVEGPWRPGSVNSSGTWDLADVRGECRRRAPSPVPPPIPEEDDDAMLDAIWKPTFTEPGYEPCWFAVFGSGAVRRASNSDVQYADENDVPTIPFGSAEQYDDFHRFSRTNYPPRPGSHYP